MAKGVEGGITDIYVIKSPADFEESYDIIPQDKKTAETNGLIQAEIGDNTPIGITVHNGNIYYGQAYGQRFLMNAQKVSEVYDNLSVPSGNISVNCIKGPKGINDLKNPSYNPQVHCVNDASRLMTHRDFITETQAIMFPNGDIVFNHILMENDTQPYTPYPES